MAYAIVTRFSLRTYEGNQNYTRVFTSDCEFQNLHDRFRSWIIEEIKADEPWNHGLRPGEAGYKIVITHLWETKLQTADTLKLLCQQPARAMGIVEAENKRAKQEEARIDAAREKSIAMLPQNVAREKALLRELKEKYPNE